MSEETKPWDLKQHLEDLLGGEEEAAMVVAIIEGLYADMVRASMAGQQEAISLLAEQKEATASLSRQVDESKGRGTLASVLASVAAVLSAAGLWQARKAAKASVRMVSYLDAIDAEVRVDDGEEVNASTTVH